MRLSQHPLSQELGVQTGLASVVANAALITIGHSLLSRGRGDFGSQQMSMY